MAGFVAKILKSGLGVFTSRIFGMVRDVCIAGYFGANGATDAFIAAFAIPNLFRAFFAEGAMTSIFVPFINEKLVKDGEKKASVYLTSLILIITAVTLLITLTGVLFPKAVTYVFLPGYADNAEILSLTAKMVSILMPYLSVVTICSLITCYLNIKGSFFVPNSSTALLNIAMIAGAFIGYHNGQDIIYVCYGVFIGGLLQLAYIFTFAYVKGYTPSLKGGYDKSVNQIFHYMLPSMAIVGINQINSMAGRILASFLAAGSISYLYYANRLFQFPMGLFAVAVGSVLMAEISSLNISGNVDGRNALINKAINSILFVMLPSAVGLMILAEPIIDLVYGRMHFTAADAAAAGSDLMMYAPGLIFYSFITVFTRVFYSEKNVKTPLIGAGIGFAVNMLFSMILMKPMEHSGIALASTIAAASTFFYLYKRVRDYKYVFDVFALKISSAAFVMAVSAFCLRMSGINILVNIVISALLYFLALLVMKMNIRNFFR